MVLDRDDALIIERIEISLEPIHYAGRETRMLKFRIDTTYHGVQTIERAVRTDDIGSWLDVYFDEAKRTFREEWKKVQGERNE